MTTILAAPPQRPNALPGWLALVWWLLVSPLTVAESLWLPYLLEAGGALPTYGASVAIDAQGGVHVAYAIYAGADQERQPAIYAYCPANPAEFANWQFARIGTAVQEVRLALDPQGRPRLLLFGPAFDPENSFRRRYDYAQCDADWTDAANWSITTLVTPIEAVGTREDNNNHYFAISPSGEVAFVYTDTPDNFHPGTFYLSCASDPRNPANWTETTLTAGYAFDKPSLAFTPEGEPRLAFGLMHEATLYLAYGQCQGDSSDPRNWTFLLLNPIHGSTQFNLRVNAAGQPRLGFSSGRYAAAPFTDHQLYYLWCDEGCATDPAGWFSQNVGVYLTSGGVDLALDSQGRPNLSFLTGEGAAYARCVENWDSEAAVWETRVVESNAALADDYAVLPARQCTVSAWVNGQRSALALDPLGNPCLVYDAQHIWSGDRLDPPWGNCYIQDIVMTRVTLVSTAPRLLLRRVGELIEIDFEHGVLEAADRLDGEWTRMPEVVSPLHVAPEQLHRFYRVRQ
jgi:hypothetical protein